MDYHLATTTPSDEKMHPKEPGAINGGLLPKDPTGTHPMIVIDVPSIEEHIKKSRVFRWQDSNASDKNW